MKKNPYNLGFHGRKGEMDKIQFKFFLLSCVGDLTKNEVVVVNRALSQQQIAIQIVIVYSAIYIRIKWGPNV